MNYGISVLFRAIPVVMAFICFFLGGFIFLYGNDAARDVAGPVVFFLGAICLALYATAATIIRQLIHKFHPFLKYLIPGFGYLVALVTIGCGIWIFSQGTSGFIVSGHVVCGVGLIACCVSTAATSSTKFYLIPQNSSSGSLALNKEGFSGFTEKILILLTVIFSIIAWVWCIILLSRIAEGAEYFVAGTVMGGLACICSSLIALSGQYFPADSQQIYGEQDRSFWPKLVFFFGTVCYSLGIGRYPLTMIGNVANTTGFIMIGLGIGLFQYFQ